MPATKIHCTVCRRANHPWRKFCGACGTGFPNACKCGFVNTADDRFCGGCGGATRATFRVAPLDKNETIQIAIDELIPSEK
ncbi:MAG: double zinc ribbon domain-containing protein [Kofleriaceae bacterium]